MTRQFSRREILRAATLGGMMIAGELWIPGQKLISIPRRGQRVWMMDGNTIIVDEWVDFENRGTWHVSLHEGACHVGVDNV